MNSKRIFQWHYSPLTLLIRAIVTLQPPYSPDRSHCDTAASLLSWSKPLWHYSLLTLLIRAIVTLQPPYSPDLSHCDTTTSLLSWSEQLTLQPYFSPDPSNCDSTASLLSWPEPLWYCSLRTLLLQTIVTLQPHDKPTKGCFSWILILLSIEAMSSSIYEKFFEGNKMYL